MTAPEIPEEAMIALKQGNKIEAIKLTRAALELGLKEAKDLVEAHIDDSPDQYQNLKLRAASWLWWVFLIIVALIAYRFIFT